ncbi:MAG: DNA polymerase III subunit alpha [Treponema sp.]|nr:DNA polymerase III subunit alpha [Treponema sp.]
MKGVCRREEDVRIRLGLVSAYSLLYGTRKPEELLDRAVSFNADTVSICDINNLYGVHSFLEAAKERNIKPIIGTTFVWKEKTNSNSSFPAYHLQCFAENRAGFSRLCELLTLRNNDKDNFNPLPLLREDSGGLVLASCDEDVLRRLAGQVKRLYAAITPLDIRAVSAGRALDIPLAFIDNSIFLEQDDYPVHRVLRAIDLLKTTGSLEPNDTAVRESVFRPSGDLVRRLSSWPQAVKGAEEIASICNYSNIFEGWIFPGYETNGISVDEELSRRVFSGNEKRFGELGEYETGRIDFELNIIKEKGFSSYFLLIDDIVKMASRTCGRGSGAASIVSYGLEITNVDPLRHKLYFERFLNPVRPDPPDLDIDFAWDERDDLIRAVIEKSGPDRCARVANHNMFRYRSALRETARAHGFTDAEISGIERKLQITNDKSDLLNDPLWSEIFQIAARIEGLPRGLGMHCGGLVITPGPIRRYSPVEKSAEGYPLLAWEKEGAEAAGFVKIDLLGNRSLAVIRDAVINIREQGIKKSENGKEKLENRISNGEQKTENREQVAANKFVIDNCDIQDRLNRSVDDAETIEALARGDSIGVFYIESPAMRQLQKKTGRGDFEHIVIHSSIIRPAANKFISEYVRRLKGAGWEPLHPRLENILNESYGILCYQEDVSKTAVALAGFNEADADKLRKIIAKKMGGTKLAVYQSKFFEGCANNGVSDETAKRIWEMMLSFDGYSFCKPHSASYAMVSFQSAYLRVHYPAEFMAAVLSNQGGYYRPHAYIAEARRMKLFITGPDVNTSRWHYHGMSAEGEKNREKSGEGKSGCFLRGTVVIGLMAVKGLSATGANAVLEERDRGGEYKSLDDFSGRVKLNRDDIIALCPAGVFDSISGGLPRPLQARCLLGSNREQNNSKDRNGELFENDTRSSASVAGNFTAKARSGTITEKTAKQYSRADEDRELQEEYRALGFLRNIHPLALWKDDVLAVKNRVKALHIGDYTGRNVKMAGWPVTQKDVWTKDGLTMCFLSLEDETALYETVVFPQIYERYSKLLFDQQPLLVYGKVTNDQGAISLEVQRIELLAGLAHAPEKSRLMNNAKIMSLDILTCK